MFLNLIGIITSFVGSLILAFSISKNPGEAYQTVRGKKKYLTIIHLCLFRSGVVLIVLGFAIQMLTLSFSKNC